MRLVDSDEVVRIVREEVKDEDNTLPVSFRAGVDYVLKIMNELSECDTSKIITANTAGNSLILKINSPDCSNQSDCEAKAIPIEWIKEVWLKREENIGDIETYCPTPTFAVVMNWLIKDWEAENEANKCR